MSEGQWLFGGEHLRRIVVLVGIRRQLWQPYILLAEHRRTIRQLLTATATDTTIIAPAATGWLGILFLICRNNLENDEGWIKGDKVLKDRAILTGEFTHMTASRSCAAMIVNRHQALDIHLSWGGSG